MRTVRRWHSACSQSHPYIHTFCLYVSTGLEANTRLTAHQILSVFAQKPTNFGLQWRVCEPFVDGATHVHSPIYIYTHLACKPFVNGLWTVWSIRVYWAWGEHGTHSTPNSLCVCAKTDKFWFATRCIEKTGGLDRNATHNKWHHWSQLISSPNVTI